MNIFSLLSGAQIALQAVRQFSFNPLHVWKIFTEFEPNYGCPSCTAFLPVQQVKTKLCLWLVALRVTLHSIQVDTLKKEFDDEDDDEALLVTRSQPCIVALIFKKKNHTILSNNCAFTL